jgi:hypothetical protein
LQSWTCQSPPQEPEEHAETAMTRKGLREVGDPTSSPRRVILMQGHVVESAYG